MCAKKGILSKGQEKLFKLIVKNYIKSTKPVGFKALCEILDCSSATVRNEMDFLKLQVLLLKTHTSSGRVPSDKILCR